MIQLEKINQHDAAALRMEYLRQLPEFQELYLEMMAEEAACFKLTEHDEFVGYVLRTEQGILVEFYLRDAFVPLCSDVFKQVLAELQIQSVYCKSFDALLLNCCLLEGMAYEPIGALFRTLVEAPGFPIEGTNTRWALPSDSEFLLQQEGELYETPQELERFVNGRNILMFEHAGALVGCGYLIRVHPNFDFYDIGMWVNPLFRKQGWATRIISHLKELCLQNHWTPICGCAIENVASQKTLERNGFVSKFKLLEFRFRPS